MPGVTARFYVAEVAKRHFQQLEYGVRLQAVSRGPENREWATATPMGQVEMTIRNAPAARWFEDRLGRDVAVTFDDAPEPGLPG